MLINIELVTWAEGLLETDSCFQTKVCMFASCLRSFKLGFLNSKGYAQVKGSLHQLEFLFDYLIN